MDLIDYMTFSFYLKGRGTAGQHSHVKFGSYDDIAIKDQSKGLTIMRTKNIYTWELKVTNPVISKSSMIIDSESYVLFDPESSFIHLPS